MREAFLSLVELFFLALFVVSTVLEIKWLSAISLTAALVTIIVASAEEPRLKKFPPKQVCTKCGKQWERSAVEIENDGYGVPWWKCPDCGKYCVVSENEKTSVDTHGGVQA